MANLESKFKRKAGKISFDLKHREKIKFNMSKYAAAVLKGRQRYSDIELAKHRAAFIKRRVLQNLDEHLIQFEKVISQRGTKVLWAENQNEVISQIVDILVENNCKMLVKSKSMTSEEIDFNHFVEKVGVRSVETDLGEFIVQVAGEKPYHIVTPAMHKSKKDIADLFHKHFNTPLEGSPEYLTNFVREKLRHDFISADVGVLGANFLVAKEGAIAMTENEGNGLLAGSFPKVQIVIAGIEKIIPSLEQLDLFWPLLSAHGTGQQTTVYNSLYFGPKEKDEVDGPEKMYVILLDNGRTTLLDTTKQYEALSCIRCGACLNACPIYKNVGGYTYQSTYSGPIGSVITPHLKNFSDYKHLSFASSLCGKCGEVCPVKIPIPELLLENRKMSVDSNLSTITEKSLMKVVTRGLKSRLFLNNPFKGLINLLVPFFSASAVGKKRGIPPFAKQSFSQQWNNKKKS